MPAHLFTIGVYEFDQRTFLAALRHARVKLLIDVRQRRGVRGPQYAWANSLRLQAALAHAGIDYEHRRDLAPTTELRHLQYAEDARQGVGKRNRHKLSDDYIHGYESEILDPVDLAPLAAQLEALHSPAALLCVERDPEACHRSLIAARLASEYGVHVGHLRPPD